MRIIAVAILIIIVPFQCLGQKDEITVTRAVKDIGINLITKQAITAIEYQLPDRIHKFEIDTNGHTLTLQLRGIKKEKWLNKKGHAVRFDLLSQKVIWSRKIAYHLESIDHYNGLIIHSSATKSYCLDSNTGLPLWKVKNAISYVDPFYQIGIGYKYDFAKADYNQLQGIDLTNGDVLWSREIEKDYGWNDVFYINDSVLLIAAAGLHTLNLLDGTGWDYHTQTVRQNYTSSAIAAGLGIATGILTGVYGVPTGPDLIGNVVSNILTDSLHFYIASKKYLAKINREGKIVWHDELDDKNTSKSNLFIRDSILYMINMGYGTLGYNRVNCGNPFLAAYDVKEGTEIYYHEIPCYKKEQINGFDLSNDTLFLVMNDRVIKYNLTSAERIAEKTFGSKELGVLKYFIGEQVFVEYDGKIKSLPDIDPTKHYLYTTGEKILVMDNDLRISDELSVEDVYVLYGFYNGMFFVAKDDMTYIVSEAGDAIAEIEASRNSQLLGNILYDQQESSFLAIDLGQILIHEPL